MSTTVSAVDSARDELSSFGDRLIGPSDATYDEARALFNAMIDRRPALIARCASADDVAAAIRFARDHDLRIAVRGGGHNGGGLGSVDNGVVIDLSALKAVSVDAQARIVGEAEAVLAEETSGDLLFVGHGAVGTLLYCHYAGLAIDRAHDQPAGGGHYFSLLRQDRQVLHPWRPMEQP